MISSAGRLTFASRAERYALDVLEGKIVAGKWVKAACQRHIDDLVRSATDSNYPWRFDEEAAGRPCHFIELLPHIKGEWARPRAENGRLIRPTIQLEEWQVFFIAVLFGWVNRVTGLRRFRRAYLEVGRKNAKSTLAAGLALFMLCADKEAGAEVYSAATKKDQAKIVWEVARQMVLTEREFGALQVGCTTRSIFQRSTGSKYEPLGRDSDSLDGLNPHCFVSDELHAQRDRGVYDVLDSATGARSQPLGVGITTAGYDTAGVCYEQREYLIGILNAVLSAHDGLGYKVTGGSVDDERYFGLIYTLDSGYADNQADDDWRDEAVWIKANPNLGVSVYLDDLRAAAEKAATSVQSQPEFRTKRCNQWLSSSAPWMDMVAWDRCADPTLKLTDFAGESCFVGLDAAFKTDVFAKMRVFRRGGDYYAFGEYWIPETIADAKENPELLQWAEMGYLHKSPGPVIDIELVRSSLVDDQERFTLAEVPYDPAMLTQFASEMLDSGFPMVQITPTFGRFSEPMKLLQELVLQGRFHHDGDPVLRWMVGNVLCVQKRGLIFPSKQIGQEKKRKIDGVIALIMAIGRAGLTTEVDINEFLSNPVHG